MYSYFYNLIIISRMLSLVHQVDCGGGLGVHPCPITGPPCGYSCWATSHESQATHWQFDRNAWEHRTAGAPRKPVYDQCWMVICKRGSCRWSERSLCVNVRCGERGRYRNERGHGCPGGEYSTHVVSSNGRNVVVGFTIL